MTQFTTTSTLEVNKRKIPKPRKGDFNYFAAREGALKVKGYKFGVKDVVLDRELEGFDTVNPFGITEETTILEAVESLANPAVIDVSDLTDTEQLLVDCISVTYEEIQQLVADNELTVGQKYAIFDYVPVWNIFDGGTMNIEEYQPGIGEILIVTAASTNSIYKEAISATHPSDTIHYSLDLLDDRDIGFGDGVGNPIAIFKGMIYYRKDTIQNVEAHYDFRNVTFRRWAVDAVEWTDIGFTTKDVIKSAIDGKIYKCIITHVASGVDPSADTTNWVLWLDITADAFVSWTSDKTLFNIGDITTDNLIINNVTEGVDYDDFATFGDYYEWVKDVSLGGINLDYIIDNYSIDATILLSQKVFKTTDDLYTCYSIKFDNNNLPMTFGNGNNSMTFGNNNSSMTFGNNNYSMTFGNGNNSMTFGDENYSMTFGNGNYSMTFGNYNYSMTFGDYNSLMIFGNDNYSMTFGDKTNIEGILLTFGNDNTMCIFEDKCFKGLATDLDLSAATHIREDYNTTIYQDKTDGVKLSYMDGGVMQIVDVTD
jgi:hypothetical protein